MGEAIEVGDGADKLQVGDRRFTGRTGSIGVFVPQDSGAPDDLAKNGTPSGRAGPEPVAGSPHGRPSHA